MSPVIVTFTLIAYTVISVAGLTLLKFSEGNIFTTYGIFGGSLYGAGFVIWYIILTYLPLSVAFPIAASSLILGTQIAGYFYLREGLPVMHITGIVVIVIGIILVFAAGNKS